MSELVIKKFKKIILQVEAYQWFKDLEEHPGVLENPEGNPNKIGSSYCNGIYVSEGDWIVKDTNDTRYYLIRKEVFNQKYEEMV